DALPISTLGCDVPASTHYGVRHAGVRREPVAVGCDAMVAIVIELGKTTRVERHDEARGIVFRHHVEAAPVVACRSNIEFRKLVVLRCKVGGGAILQGLVLVYRQRTSNVG